MYKLYKGMYGNLVGVIRSIDGACIPFDPANTDYQQFRKDVASGSELQDADGNLMTPEEAKAYVATLP